jgi:hypothetical protein
MPDPSLNAGPLASEFQPDQPSRPSIDVGLAAMSIPSASTLSIDIVLVHGLNGTRSTTWTSQQDTF